MSASEVIGAPMVIGGRKLSLSPTMRAEAGCNLADVGKAMVRLRAS